jgi:hypothetical protein
MNTNDAILRLRRANPATASPRDPAALFTAITVTAGDPRLERDRRRARRGTRALVVAAAALVVGVGAAWAAGGPPWTLFRSAQNLFEANPAYDPAAPGDELWNQSVLPASVRKAAVVAIPGLGPVEFWYAATREGGWCGALRLPSGAWNDSPVPGCQPSRKQVNSKGPVYVIDGFDYDVATIVEKKTVWDVYYGVVDGTTPAARVVDVNSGRSAAVRRGTFALVEQDTSAPPPARPSIARLVAYDAAGQVVAQEPPQG